MLKLVVHDHVHVVRRKGATSKGDAVLVLLEMAGQTATCGSLLGLLSPLLTESLVSIAGRLAECFDFGLVPVPLNLVEVLPQTGTLFLLEDLHLEWIDVPLLPFFVHPHELLHGHQNSGTGIALGQVLKHELGVSWHYFDAKAIQPSCPVLQGHPVPALEIKVTKGIGQNLESSLDIHINQLKHLLEVWVVLIDLTSSC